jgi:hypothetical protein
MTWRRGLMRIWVVLAVTWICYTVWRFLDGCFYFPDSSVIQPICNTGNLSDDAPVAGSLGEFGALDWFRWLRLALLPPATILVIGVLVNWALTPRLGRCCCRGWDDLPCQPERLRDANQYHWRDRSVYIFKLESDRLQGHRMVWGTGGHHVLGA